MKNRLPLIALLCLFITISGCATMTIEGDGRKTPMSKTGTHVKHGSFYNIVWSEPPVDKCENSRGLYRVRHHTNAAYALVSLISLGLYVPQTAQWWCDGTPVGDGEEEEYIPSN